MKWFCAQKNRVLFYVLGRWVLYSKTPLRFLTKESLFHPYILYTPQSSCVLIHEQNCHTLSRYKLINTKWCMNINVFHDLSRKLSKSIWFMIEKFVVNCLNCIYIIKAVYFKSLKFLYIYIKLLCNLWFGVGIVYFLVMTFFWGVYMVFLRRWVKLLCNLWFLVCQLAVSQA